ncbi:MAG: EAL domain-containing protein, partial [Acidimicrobiales bacterium]
TPGFCDTVADLLRRTDTDPPKLILDINEAVFHEDAERALVVLTALKQVGVTVAIDDFGSGFASLNFFKRFPVDVVKLDRELVAEMGQDPASAAIAAAVVDLAHTLRLSVVAEGVENADQRRRIADLGCDLSQGYFFARPTSAEDLHDQMRQLSCGQRLHYPLPGRRG